MIIPPSAHKALSLSLAAIKSWPFLAQSASYLVTSKVWRQIWVLSWQLSWHHYQSYIEEEADNESGGAALDQLTQFIFHSASAELSLTITATNCFVNLNMGEGEGRREEAANISNENSFYLKPGFCILGKKLQCLLENIKFIWHFLELSNK